METVLLPWLARAGAIIVRVGTFALCCFVGVCTAACSSNPGSAPYRKRKSSKIHRCFLFLVNFVAVVLGAVILQSGVSGQRYFQNSPKNQFSRLNMAGLVATDSGVAGA